MCCASLGPLSWCVQGLPGPAPRDLANKIREDGRAALAKLKADAIVIDEKAKEEAAKLHDEATLVLARANHAASAERVAYKAEKLKREEERALQEKQEQDEREAHAATIIATVERAEQRRAEIAAAVAVAKEEERQAQLAAEAKLEAHRQEKAAAHWKRRKREADASKAEKERFHLSLERERLLLGQCTLQKEVAIIREDSSIDNNLNVQEGLRKAREQRSLQRKIQQQAMERSRRVHMTLSKHGREIDMQHHVRNRAKERLKEAREHFLQAEAKGEKQRHDAELLLDEIKSDVLPIISEEPMSPPQFMFSPPPLGSLKSSPKSPPHFSQEPGREVSEVNTVVKKPEDHAMRAWQEDGKKWAAEQTQRTRPDHDVARLHATAIEHEHHGSMPARYLKNDAVLTHHSAVRRSAAQSHFEAMKRQEYAELTSARFVAEAAKGSGSEWLTYSQMQVPESAGGSLNHALHEYDVATKLSSEMVKQRVAPEKAAFAIQNIQTAAAAVSEAQKKMHELVQVSPVPTATPELKKYSPAFYKYDREPESPSESSGEFEPASLEPVAHDSVDEPVEERRSPDSGSEGWSATRSTVWGSCSPSKSRSFSPSPSVTAPRSPRWQPKPVKLSVAHASALANSRVRAAIKRAHGIKVAVLAIPSIC